MENVFAYFEKNPNVAYSSTTISKKFKMKRGYVNFFLTNCDEITRVNPVSVGSGKTFLRVYRWKFV
jgi:hypothetical protein